MWHDIFHIISPARSGMDVSTYVYVYLFTEVLSLGLVVQKH